MKKYNFDEFINRKGTDSVKWGAPFKTTAEEIYPLWVADMDFACCDSVIEALHKRVDERIFGYNMGFDTSYKNTVCSWFLKRFDWEIHPDTIVHCGGIVSAIAYLLEILSNEGDGILIQTPVYHPFKRNIEVCKRIVVENPLINTVGYYTIDFKDLEEKMKREDVKGLILCSPHNPVGRVWSEEELLKVVEIAKKYDKWIISDEIHCDLIRKDKVHIPLLKLAPTYANRIVACTAPSKTFNLAGMHNSNIIITNPTYRSLWKSYVYNRLGISPNSFALSASIAAYEDGEEWLNQVNAYLDENVECAKQYLKEHLPKAIISDCEGTYLMWIDLRAYCMDEKKLEECMLAHGIILDEGYIFGEAGVGFERINVACPRVLLLRCLSLFVSVVKDL